MDLFDLGGKVAVVTGGNGGIGLGMARGLARAGAAVAVVGRNQAKSAAAVAELQGLGAKAVAIAADVSNGTGAAAMVDAVVAALGRIDILVNNAGTNIRKRPEELSEDEWHTVVNANLTSAFVCSKACYPHMKKAGAGKILNNGSMMSIFGAPWSPVYAATKGGMVQLTKSLATAWARDNIQVNCFLPGWIDTDLTQGARQQIPGLHEKVLDRTPAARWGVPDDFQGLAVFLAGRGSDFVTGTAIPVDGGYSVMG
ncbi:MAG: SDR family oxidoreductase [Ectothiorhodospiraceae bacterium]|nr:SDR family oxidoreductase [Chromatiales bacterium]MCP5156386.1 SDR family oxidoreductase [Ectothiorhodospiraceae bacterium]